MPTFEIPTALLESPSFQLERLRRRTRDIIEAGLVDKEVSLREFWVLSCLMNTNATSQTALCELLAVDASDMVRLIDALEKKKWVKRERDAKDRRRQIVRATKKGRKAQEELATIVSQAEHTALYESTHKQLKHLRRLAHAIIDAELSDAQSTLDENSLH
ncbi:MarR family transcriptional regulator [Corynebacterium sp. ES2794-CONJ1]|uniref:MarR family winged helix-turn-helix transcriptional regulator n=1 Tax=unclassified Corynebacterium TaxID=2624378 RepID=UPI00216A743D|nr:MULTISPECIES: MarR family transcriptional regulator [unclassified Corynebacterium]MCS4490233.1 MarR family transcriptional regulator [Corynebacterium sp. ES2775-CONJ]MCS4491956.1 MarR family transcriptional regulator [Corynebacterium sp. ES2715-CONJ3]MCS4532060.1 MarR family transcriptional regulator [Corynebacterium sp. ES2730-CONJ]MCU9519462.1 MarR family transcriptional regulator [Corynebacterium sp. ES2794-CONJ1]